MPRKVPNKKPAKGSQRWVQFFVNEQTSLLDHAVRRATTIASEVQITWQSPLATDDFAEYSDQAFLDRLGLSAQKVPLFEFWPSNGAHWDALTYTISCTSLDFAWIVMPKLRSEATRISLEMRLFGSGVQLRGRRSVTIA